MTTCPRSPVKHRVSKPHGGHSHGSGKRDYARGNKGHSWVKNDKQEYYSPVVCGRCGRGQ